jgi:hypothetical protein
MSDVDELARRVAALEKRGSRPRGRTNLTGAAAYLDISRERLRQLHLEGRGPPRRRRGTRGWDYSYSDLDTFQIN